MAKKYQHWILEIKDKIAHLILNRPEMKNRLDDTTLSELQEITQVLRDDPEVWVVILKSNGDTFSAGVDVNLIGRLVGQDEQVFKDNLKALQVVLDEFEALEKPTIAAMQGAAIGGGVILALCCDFRIAADNVLFGFPEVKRSIGVIMGTQRITRTIGISHTKELVLLGNNINGEKALWMGLINDLVPLNKLEEQAQKLAEQFLALPPLAVGLSKKIIQEGQFMERAGQDLEMEAQSKLLQTEDFKEAIASFFEKRKPLFKGK
ncbi:MAG: enoyl-CoA hydratase/isomerase family protein [Bacteroidota bacterium]